MLYDASNAAVRATLRGHLNGVRAVCVSRGWPAAGVGEHGPHGLGLGPCQGARGPRGQLIRLGSSSPGQEDRVDLPRPSSSNRPRVLNPQDRVVGVSGTPAPLPPGLSSYRH